MSFFSLLGKLVTDYLLYRAQEKIYKELDKLSKRAENELSRDDANSIKNKLGYKKPKLFKKR